MKKLFLIALISVLFAPKLLLAQVEVTDAPSYLNYSLTDPNVRVVLVDIGDFLRVKLTPSGNCQVKIEFPASGDLLDLKPDGGSIDVPLARFAVWVHIGDGKITHFESDNTVARLSSSGMCYVVCNWEASEATGYED